MLQSQSFEDVIHAAVITRGERQPCWLNAFNTCHHGPQVMVAFILHTACFIEAKHCS